jgi:hypothetical protein
MPQPQIVVESDYDGYFESLVRRLLAEVPEPKVEKVTISAGPWRSYGVQYELSEDKKELHLDFYSALRRGFGSLSQSDLEGIKALL